jgi:hypothetical protein
MALIECPECGKHISEQASICPNCGFKVSKYRAKKVCKNSIDKLKEKRIHLSKQSFKKLFNINYMMFKINNLPLVLRFVCKLLFGLFVSILSLLALAIFLAVIIAIFYVIELIMEINVTLGFVALGILLLVANYFVWYKDRRLKFWCISIVIALSISTLIWIMCTM